MSNPVDKYICDACHFTSNKQGDYNKHLLTRKHANTSGHLQKVQRKYSCSCGKAYTHRQSLYNHKKICTMPEKEENNTEKETDASNNIMQVLLKEHKEFKTMLQDLIKNNNELQKQMLDMCKKKDETD